MEEPPPDTTCSPGEVQTWYHDLDQDGYGDPDSSQEACGDPSVSTDYNDGLKVLPAYYSLETGKVEIVEG